MGAVSEPLGPAGAAACLRVGDPRRPLLWLAVRRTFLLALVFSLSTGAAKQLPAIYHHAPWMAEPYDGVVSFSMLFVPVVTLAGIARIWLCRPHEELPLERVRDVFRACDLVIVAVVTTSAMQWAAVAAHANSGHWNAATWLQIGMLTVVSLAAVPATVDLTRMRLPRPAVVAPVPLDSLSDLHVLARRACARLGPAAGASLRTVDWVESRALPHVRRHPLWASGIVCAALGIALGSNQAIQQAYDPASAALVVALIGCGSFLLLVTAGAFLGLVRAPVRLVGLRRRSVDAFVVTIFCGLVAFALRYHLWWLVNTTSARAGDRQLSLLLTGVAIPTFLLALGLETALGLHRRGIVSEEWAGSSSVDPPPSSG